MGQFGPTWAFILAIWTGFISAILAEQVTVAYRTVSKEQALQYNANNELVASRSSPPLLNGILGDGVYVSLEPGAFLGSSSCENWVCQITADKQAFMDNRKAYVPQWDKIQGLSTTLYGNEEAINSYLNQLDPSLKYSDTFLVTLDMEEDHGWEMKIPPSKLTRRGGALNFYVYCFPEVQEGWESVDATIWQANLAQ
ncbi:uncharacterized protein N7459_006939 [Penicillium hispanicum]|uniref:uncharacterized protein n=1 Tax=Penicillium hispanicum TaxID=1080232 RepID=UPI0025424CF2|nr:uncharacterized protein N7459_006939 [Penicillium hispanicum]KAJ5577975.1 hypothetical protein N7459_006939 [Penicillium hispanicum]